MSLLKYSLVDWNRQRTLVSQSCLSGISLNSGILSIRFVCIDTNLIVFVRFIYKPCPGSQGGSCSRWGANKIQGYIQGPSGLCGSCWRTKKVLVKIRERSLCQLSLKALVCEIITKFNRISFVFTDTNSPFRSCAECHKNMGIFWTFIQILLIKCKFLNLLWLFLWCRSFSNIVALLDVIISPSCHATTIPFSWWEANIHINCININVMYPWIT